MFAIEQVTTPSSLKTDAAEGAAEEGANIIGTSHDLLKPTQDWIDPAKVDENAQQLRNGEQVDPIEVQYGYILDRHHRWVASQLAGIPAPIRELPGFGPIGLPDWTDVTRMGGAG
jgi:hypothetical protein